MAKQGNLINTISYGGGSVMFQSCFFSKGNHVEIYSIMDFKKYRGNLNKSLASSVEKVKLGSGWSIL